MQDVCDLMLHRKLGVNQELGSFAITQQNLADYVVHLALQKGTTDNVAAVVVPLGSPSSSGATLEDRYHIKGNSKAFISPLQTVPYQQKSGTLTVPLLIYFNCNHLVICTLPFYLKEVVFCLVLTDCNCK